MIVERIPHNITSRQLYLPSACTVPLQPFQGGYKVGNQPYGMQSAWLSLIKKYAPYYWFATLTFRDPVHVEVAVGRFKRWIRHVNIALYGGNFVKKKKGVTWFRAMERQKRGVLHFHCLIGSPDMYRLRRDVYME